MRKHLDAYLPDGQIEPASSQFGAVVLFAQNKVGAKSLRTNQRALSKITIKNKYPIPRIDKLLENICGGRARFHND